MDLDRLARSQWGLLTSDQLRQNVSRSRLATMFKRRQLIVEHRGVYRTAGSPRTWQQRIVAAMLVLPQEVVASHQSAARLHGLKVPYDELPHVTIGIQRSHVRSNVNIHRAALRDDHVAVVQKIACTSVERTIVDLASVLTRKDLAIVMDEAVVAGKTSFTDIDRVLGESGSQGRRGSRNLKALLRDRLPLPKDICSVIQLKVAKAAKRAGLPEPVVEHPVKTSVKTYYLDVAWPDCKIGAEADGYSVHSASRLRHTDDRRRRNALESAGWKILNFTYDMPIHEVVATLRENFPRSLGG